MAPSQSDSAHAQPPLVRITDFLGETTSGQLLDYALAHEDGFKPSDVRRKGQFVVDPSVRLSRKFLQLANFKHLIETTVENRLGEVLRQLGIKNLEPHFYELEMVWHGDGAFFKRHIDTLAQDTPSSHRILSMVYYFHRKPNAFRGGNLRLYSLGADIELRKEIEPDSDSAVFFPSWIPHEVLPVHCDSKAFEDGRFAINCWVHKPRAGKHNRDVP